jgi:hypothetical protein
MLRGDEYYLHGIITLDAREFMFNNNTHKVLEDKTSVEEMFDGLVKKFQKSSIPDSISILINYGTDNNHILYDATHANHNYSQIQTWNPFSEVCQDVYCVADTDLVEYDCQGEPNDKSRCVKEIVFNTHLQLIF